MDPLESLERELEIATRRDIRPDLKERLREAVALRDQYRAKADAYDADVDMLTRMIEREDARYAIQHDRAPEEALAEFIVKAVKTRPLSKEELREMALRAGYQIDGRSIHATTVNLSRTGRIVEIRDGVFATPEEVANRSLRRV